MKKSVMMLHSGSVARAKPGGGWSRYQRRRAGALTIQPMKIDSKRKYWHVREAVAVQKE